VTDRRLEVPRHQVEQVTKALAQLAAKGGIAADRARKLQVDFAAGMITPAKLSVEVARWLLWIMLDEILNAGFNGQITLNCQQGTVQKYELREVRPAPTGHDPPEQRKAS